MSLHNLINVQISNTPSKIIEMWCKMCTQYIMSNVHLLWQPLLDSEFTTFSLLLFPPIFPCACAFGWSLFLFYHRCCSSTLSTVAKETRSLIMHQSTLLQRYIMPMWIRICFSVSCYDICTWIFCSHPFSIFISFSSLKCLHIALYNLNELFGTFAHTSISQNFRRRKWLRWWVHVDILCHFKKLLPNKPYSDRTFFCCSILDECSLYEPKQNAPLKFSWHNDVCQIRKAGTSDWSFVVPY